MTNQRKTENRIVLATAATTTLVILAEDQSADAYFVVLAVAAFSLLWLVLSLAHRTADVSDIRLDADLRRDLLDHQLSNPTYESQRITALSLCQPKSITTIPRLPKEITAHYN